MPSDLQHYCGHSGAVCWRFCCFYCKIFVHHCLSFLAVKLCSQGYCFRPHIVILHCALVCALCHHVVCSLLEVNNSEVSFRCMRHFDSTHNAANLSCLAGEVSATTYTQANVVHSIYFAHSQGAGSWFVYITMPKLVLRNWRARKTKACLHSFLQRFWLSSVDEIFTVAQGKACISSTATRIKVLQQLAQAK